MGADDPKCSENYCITKDCKGCGRKIENEECKETKYDQYKRFRYEGKPPLARRIWIQDEEWENKLKCMDESHSYTLGISEECLDFVEDDLNNLMTNTTQEYACRAEMQSLMDCLKDADEKNRFYCCRVPLERFKQCVACATNRMAYDAYKKQCIKKK